MNGYEEDNFEDETTADIENTLAKYISKLEPWQQDELKEEVDEELGELVEGGLNTDERSTK